MRGPLKPGPRAQRFAKRSASRQDDATLPPEERAMMLNARRLLLALAVLPLTAQISVAQDRPATGIADLHRLTCCRRFRDGVNVPCVVELRPHRRQQRRLRGTHSFIARGATSSSSPEMKGPARSTAYLDPHAHRRPDGVLLRRRGRSRGSRSLRFATCISAARAVPIPSAGGGLARGDSTHTCRCPTASRARSRSRRR
jgi:hypothetical protein